MRPTSRIRLASALTLAGLGAWAAPASAQEWRWNVAPYLWGSTTGLDVSVNDHEAFDHETSFSDLADGLDFALQLHVEGQKGRHGLLFDLTYMDLGDEDKSLSLPAPFEGGLTIDNDLRLTVFEAAGIFNPRGDGLGFALLYGARVLDVREELDVRLDLPGPLPDLARGYDTSATLVDGMLGGRLYQPLSDRITLHLRGDLAAGGTEITWNAQAGVMMAFGDSGRYSGYLGYRHMEIELQEEDERAEVETTVTFTGPVVGLRVGL